MFSKFPYFFVTFSSLCIMQEKNYGFKMTIHCDSVVSQLLIKSSVKLLELFFSEHECVCVKTSNMKVCHFAESNYSSALMEKMFDGNTVLEGGKKFLAALVHNFKHYGTGFFVTDRILLTAASHLEKFFMCDDVDFDEFYAYVRSHILYKNGRQYYFEHVEVHKKYDFHTKLPYYDIGTIKVHF